MNSNTKTRNRLTTALMVFMGVAVAGVLASGGCSSETMEAANGTQGSGPNPNGSGAVRVETIRVETRDLAKTVEMPGTVEGYETADLYAKVGGYLDKFFPDENGDPVDIGSPIEKGQPLARLAIPEMEKQLNHKKALAAEAEAQVEQAQAAINQAEADLASAEATLEEAKSKRAKAEAELRYAQADYKRQKELFEARATKRELFEQAQAQLDSAEATLASVEAGVRTAEAKLNGTKAHLATTQSDYKRAQKRVEAAWADVEYIESLMQYATINSPYDGLVTRRYVHPGAFIQPADGNSAAKPLLTVTRTEPKVRIRLDVPMNDVRWLDRGDRAVLDRINVLPGREFEGEVTRFSPSVDMQSRLMRVEVDLENPEGILRPGYYGYVTVYLEELPETPVVPSSALLTDEESGEEVVYLVQDGIAHKRVVTTNYSDGAIVGIASGLEGGEEVVRAGGGQIDDGDSVTAVLVEEETAMSE